MKTLYWYVPEVSPRNAGYRVRTLPIVDELRAQGLAVEVLPLADLAARVQVVASTALAVVISKPPDSSAHLVVKHLTDQGIPVIVDLFDNYFAWSSPMFPKQVQWHWLRALDAASMVMCSTDYLKGVVQSLTGKPVLRVGDAVPAIDASRVMAANSKWQAPRRIELLWFGISSNPYYRAGLEDLRSWVADLQDFGRQVGSKFDIRLTLCTNRVPAVDVVMQELRVRQIDARFVEWTAEACDALLDDTHVVLLPTNVSGFSLSKTHNRCSEALAHGCVTLCSPHGPYAALGGAVFTDIDVLGTTLMRATTEGVRQLIDHSVQVLRQQNDIRAEVTRFKEAVLGFAAQPKRAASRGWMPPKVLIAARGRQEQVRLGRTLGYLTAGFEGGALDLHYDFRLEALPITSDQPTLLLSAPAAASLEKVLLNNIDFDVRDDDLDVDVQGAGVRFRFERDTRLLMLVEGFDPDEMRRLRILQQRHAGGRAAAPEWYDLHVDVITRLLRQIGFTAMEFATDEEGGWPAYAANAAPALDEASRRLERLWAATLGNELDWSSTQLPA